MNTALPQSNANGLLDHLLEKLSLKNDAALSRALGVAPPAISKIRHNRLAVGAAVILRIMEKADMSLAEIEPFLAAPAA